VESRFRVYPQCEACWIEENSTWEPDGVSSDGRLVSRILEIAVPVDLESGQVNVCCSCGELTVVGIYVEREKDRVKFDIDPQDLIR
jgi:hypothetical protein